MTDILKNLRIFVACPGDVTPEREEIVSVAASLKPMADSLGLILEVIDWRQVVPDAGRGQQVIFDQLQATSWDIFVCILWHKFGSPTGRNNPVTNKPFLSGTEEEFYEAYNLYKANNKPRIVLYHCKRSVPYDADSSQHQMVKDFIKEIQDANSDFSALTQSFESTESFEKMWLTHLQQILLEYKDEKGITTELPRPRQILCNLPSRGDFFGRETEKNKVLEALKLSNHTWGIYVDGMGGMGKTSLAIESAHLALGANMFDAFVFVTAKIYKLETGGITSTTSASQGMDDFLTETARVLEQKGIAQLASEHKQAALLTFLKSTNTLLIYDNLESLSKQDQKAVEDFLQKLPPNCKAIITSRIRSYKPDSELRIEKIDWEAAKGIIENKKNKSDRLSKKMNGQGSKWNKLYDATQGSPLVLLHILGLIQVRARLDIDGALELLGSLKGNDDIVQFLFNEARKELRSNDEDALRTLSFFVPSTSFESWVEVSAISKGELEKTIDHLDDLSLIEIQNDRYSLHPLTRAYVQTELLKDDTIAYETGIRFAQYWLKYAKKYGGQERESYQTFNVLEKEWTNLEAVANWLWLRSSAESGRPNKIMAAMFSDLKDNLRVFFLFSGLWDEWIQIGSRSYETMVSLNEWSQAGWGAYDVAFIYSYRSQESEASSWADKCEVALMKSNNKRNIAFSKRIQGVIAETHGDYPKAESIFKDALEIFKLTGDNGDVSMILNDIGVTALNQNKYEEAEKYFRESLEIDIKRRDNEGIALTMSNLATMEVNRKNWQAANYWLELALPLAKEIGKKDMIAATKYSIARIYEEENQLELALLSANEAFSIYNRLQDRDLEKTRILVERLKKKIDEEK